MDTPRYRLVQVRQNLKKKRTSLNIRYRKAKALSVSIPRLLTALWDFNSYCHCVFVGSVLGFAVMSSSAPPVAQYVQCWPLRFFFFFFFFFFFILIIFHLHLHFTYLCDLISFYLHSCTMKWTKICLNWREDIHSGLWEMHEAKSLFLSLLFLIIIIWKTTTGFTYRVPKIFPDKITKDTVLI